jgi:hypothetical protein
LNLKFKLFDSNSNSLNQKSKTNFCSPLSFFIHFGPNRHHGPFVFFNLHLKPAQMACDPAGLYWPRSTPSLTVTFFPLETVKDADATWPNGALSLLLFHSQTGAASLHLPSNSAIEGYPPAVFRS